MLKTKKTKNLKTIYLYISLLRVKFAPYYFKDYCGLSCAAF